MFKKQSGLVIRLLCLTIAIMFTFCGCGKNKEAANTGVTKLKMILVGEKPAIYDEIYGKLNEMLREDIGAELEVEYYNFSDVQQKYSLLFSTNEQFDIVFSANWLMYNQQASKNGFLEITDEMLQKSAPKTYASLTDAQKNEAKVNGKMFMIPNSALEYNEPVALIRGDLREKYGLPELKNIQDFENYLVAVAKNDKSFIPFCDINAVMDFWVEVPHKIARITPSGLSSIVYEYPADKLVISSDTEIYSEYAHKRRELADKGIIPADLIANKSTDNMFENGKAASYCKNLETVSSLAKKLRAVHPDWKVELYDLTGDQPKIPNSYIGNGLSLCRTTKNVEKSLQLIDLLRNDSRYFNLTWYGIEGKHWKSEGAHSYRSLNENLPDNEKYTPGCVWGWKNSDMMLTDVENIPEKQEILEKWKTQTVDVPINGFNFDDSLVKTEIASVSSVNSQYGSPLTNGLIEMGNVDAAIKTYKDKLKQANIQKIYDEAVRQYSEYLKNTK